MCFKFSELRMRGSQSEGGKTSMVRYPSHRTVNRWYHSGRAVRSCHRYMSVRHLGPKGGVRRAGDSLAKERLTMKDLYHNKSITVTL